MTVLYNFIMVEIGTQILIEISLGLIALIFKKLEIESVAKTFGWFTIIFASIFGVIDIIEALNIIK